MAIERFEDLEVWKESMRLTVEIYNQFKSINDFGLCDQMQRASVSIPSNISEGYERNSNKEFIRFLYIDQGSCGELRTQLCLATELNFVKLRIQTGLRFYYHQNNSNVGGQRSNGTPYIPLL